MNLDFLTTNFIIAVAQFLWFTAFIFTLWVIILDKKMPKHTKKIWVVMFIVFVFFNLQGTNAPRFVIDDEAGNAPTVDGTIKSLAPERVTDEDRLKYNRELNEENAIDAQ